jgi:polyisoprenoid-binding protein YceI
MFRNLSVAMIALLLSNSPAVFAATYIVDPVHSHVQFTVGHLVVFKVKGTFDQYQGVIETAPGSGKLDSVKATIQTASIDTRDKKRDDHLRSADFFDVAKYPTMIFVSKKVAKNGKDNLKVTGDLTLHGVTKEVVLDVEGPSVESKDPWGNIRKGATATTKINRKDFGLVWNAALETGGVVVGDDVNIILEIEMIKKS